MANSDQTNPPFVETVFHPSDLSAASEPAFAHALAVALFRRAEFTILHVADSAADSRDWKRFPSVRETLVRWGLLEEGSPRSAVLDSLSVRVRKISATGRTPSIAILDYLGINPNDLIVLSTEGRDGLPRWFRPSVAERVARRSQAMTLFVPQTGGGFVSRQTGEITLRRALIPIDFTPDPQRAVEYCARAAMLAGDPVEITLVHVGRGSSLPKVQLPASKQCTWQTIRRDGEVVQEIIAAATELGVDLIAMTTSGREGVLDVMRGSVTEQVLRQAGCPVLAVPVR